MRFSSIATVLGSLGLASAAAPVVAADLPVRSEPPVFTQPATTGFIVTIGAGPDVVRAFPGAQALTVLPTFHFSYRKVGEPEEFYTPDDSTSISIYENKFFRLGPAVNYINNRGLSGGNGRFYGLHDIGGSIELGGFVEVYPVPNHLRLRGEILQGVTGSKALVGNVGADAYQQIGPVQISVGPRFGFGDQRYVDQYFSITPFEAAVNGFVSPYRAYAGLTSIGGVATVKYDFAQRYSVLLFGGYNRLVNGAGNSPVATVLGSPNQFSAGATLNYAFNFKGFGIFGY